MKTTLASVAQLQIQQAAGKKTPQGTDGFNQALAQHMDAKKQTQTNTTTEQKQPIDGKQSENSKEGEEETYPAYAFTSPFLLYRNENAPAAGLALQTAESGNVDIQTWQAPMEVQATTNPERQSALAAEPQMVDVNQTELVQATIEKNPSANEGQVEVDQGWGAMDVASIASGLKTKGIYAETTTDAENRAIQATAVTDQQTNQVDAETIPSPCTESEETQAKAAAIANSDPGPIETEPVQTVEEAFGRALLKADKANAEMEPTSGDDKTAVQPALQSNGWGQPLMMPQAIGESLAIPEGIKTANQTEIVQSIREMMQVQMPQLQNGETAVVRVRLSPEHLGEIEIQIKVVDNGLDATFVVHSTETKELINNQVLQITESLRQQQLTLANVQVSLASDNQMDFSFFDGFGQSKKEAHPQHLKRQTNKRDAPAEAEGDNAVSANGISILA
ncbi:flagellar hook-length control protein flik [Trichococcus palustris]|uniref:Flagellar hook-length control protein flik n=1 Tax=Trichococcus palustris TaxID=140314 RepID=A0A143YZM7_9LACT|nr:flagellar hook-length control protein FliK [Trichococcus palustris]CZR02549.1 flagellar hook-length control protein flik [Trichococcus palustris]SFL13461.1 hook-length control protein FliK [Trichococcus palustris]